MDNEVAGQSPEDRIKALEDKVQALEERLESPGYISGLADKISRLQRGY